MLDRQKRKIEDKFVEEYNVVKNKKRIPEEKKDAFMRKRNEYGTIAKSQRVLEPQFSHHDCFSAEFES